MPSYTKDELTAMEADRRQFKWCRSCKRYWSKRGYGSHARACPQKLTVTITMPVQPKPKKGDVVIISPAYEQFIKLLVKMYREWDRTHPHATGTPEAATEHWPEPEYETITVDEAIARYGMTRDEVMAKFDEIPTKTVTKRFAR